jgi:hypothetical protein
MITEADFNVLTMYKKANQSFREKLVFRLGARAGFFSEYNNMLFSMIYCLRNNIQFELHSKKSNLSETGWSDYFIPFCSENNDSWHIKYNHSWISPKPESLKKLLSNCRLLFLCYWNNVHYLTSDVFHVARTQHIDEDITIPELNYNGDFLDLCNVLVKTTYRFNEKTQQDIENRTKNLQLDKYVGFHIRRGDKVQEADVCDIEKYIAFAENVTDIREAFIATDDFRIVRDMKNNFPSWQFHTLTSDSETGYDYNNFYRSSSMEKRDHLLDFFASVDFLMKADVFVGTYSSNVGLFAKMHRYKKPTYAIDYSEWLIW